MSVSPCAGHPCDCNSCVFSSTGITKPAHSTVVVAREVYGCVKGFGDVLHNGSTLGQMRGKAFHPISPEGAAFLRESKNPLARHA
ncbi:hypothetical protein COU17_00790 [Candidatus Kaiserbacteria bacterium CG10_big_fil_rev_8_21_14_0_10_49_17]|uniref:Uncharacterized protein n=1 Tax=Candidatus Kaiserbacteria bacterium CG10_big_fil_rev_8_21_14_0_10_49_17 TaxID=1974609 RepID=A0A2M6WEY7_9BACT|nr:MAG: hypothetical protein COU17_00790 [Candidatus Kaiserbacteria bacterium CG10_big_fil_rev_8_21_14_0_10_49_17]